MTKKIFKHEVAQSEIDDLITIDMPAGARILHVAEQRAMSGAITIWFEHDESQPPAKRLIAIRGTGHDLPGDTSGFIGTVVTCGGMLVWHLYDLGEKTI